MKSISLLMAILLSLSTTAFAQSPATEAVTRLFTAGTYVGFSGSEKCTVTIQGTTDSVTISVSNNKNSDLFMLVNTSTNYKINDNTGAISAVLSLNYPRYIKGGTKVLNVIPDDIDQVEFSVTQLLEDHQGNDFSTYASCTIAK